MTRLSRIHIPHNPSQHDELLLEELKEILLNDDRQEIHRIREILETQPLLAQHIDPIIEEHLEQIRAKLPAAYREEMERIIDMRLKDSQQEILDVLYPVFGKMIQKYINHQFEVLRESIEQRVQSGFGLKLLWINIKARIFGIKQADFIIQEQQETRIEGIYIIQKNSGLLIGSYNNNEYIDKDTMAGMLTAIKSFGEDAFARNQDALEMIEYDNFKLYLQNIISYYFVIIVNGTLTAKDKELLRGRLFQFADQRIDQVQEINSEKSTRISLALGKYFFDTELRTNDQ